MKPSNADVRRPVRRPLPIQVRDEGDLEQIYAVPMMVANYKYILKLKPTKFPDKLITDV